MTSHASPIVWKLADVPIPPKLSIQKLRWLENRLLGITHDFGTERKTTTSYEPQFRQLLHNFYHSTDEKTIDKEVICRLIVPTLQQHKTYLSIGAGEGKLSANVLAMGQFKEAYLVERNNDVVPVLKKFFSMNFKNRKPTFIHEVLQTIAVSQGFEFGKPRLKYHILQGEFGKSKQFYEGAVKDFLPFKFLYPADLVCLDHMLYFVKYESGSHSEWINVAKQAYSLVNPGGALVILVHGDGVFQTNNEVASIITSLGGQNDDINGFAMRLQTELSDANFEFIAAPTRHWAASKDSMKHILKFFMMDSNAPTGPEADEAMRIYTEQHLHLQNENIYECVKADKFIVAHKKGVELQPVPEGFYTNPLEAAWNTIVLG